MIQGKVLYGPMKSSVGSNWLTVTDIGIHYEGKATPFHKVFAKKVELDIPFSELECIKAINTCMISGQGHSFTFYADERSDEGLEYVHQHAAVNEETKTKELEKELEKEHVMKCNVCGHVFCYTNLDVESNKRLQLSIADKELSAARNTLWVSTSLGGAQYQQAEMMKTRSKDFKHCPKCNSADISEIPEGEPIPAAETPAAPAASAMDELKKLKELLDMGIVTQEEFDAKKKQLLGL